MKMTKNEIRKIIEKMTLEQKIGQRFTFGFSGSIVTDDFIRTFEKYHCGGLRLSPYSNNFEYKTKPSRKAAAKKAGECPSEREKMLQVAIAPYLTPEQYAGLIDRFQKMAKKLNRGIPLHISVDQEGDMSADIVKAGVALFGSQMGMAATRKPALVTQAAAMIAKQLRYCGVNMTHAPVLDVNILPDNIETDVRSFSSDPKVCAQYGLAMLKGYHQNGLIATGKHFPGRGNSNVDAHDEIPVINGSLEKFMKLDFVPFKALIDKGLDAVMIAHTIYPGLDRSGLMATVSPTIVKGVLRGKLGFNGVVTTDSITMAALVEKYGAAVGAAMSLEAGCDLVLMKEETPLRSEMFNAARDFVKTGRIPMDELDSSVGRIIKMKSDRGLINAEPAAPKAAVFFPSTKALNLSRKVAEESLVITKNEDKVIPLKKDVRVYMVEQVFFDRSPNDFWNHPRKLFEIFLSRGINVKYRSEVIYKDYAMGGKDQVVDMKKALKYINKKDYDLLIIGAIFYRNYHTETKIIKEAIRRSKKPVLVLGNTPYGYGYVKSARNAVLNFTSSPSGFEALADLLVGKIKAKGKMPLSGKLIKKLI